MPGDVPPKVRLMGAVPLRIACEGGAGGRRVLGEDGARALCPQRDRAWGRAGFAQ